MIRKYDTDKRASVCVHTRITPEEREMLREMTEKMEISGSRLIRQLIRGMYRSFKTDQKRKKSGPLLKK